MTTALAVALAAFVASSSPLSVKAVSNPTIASGTEMTQVMPAPRRRPTVCTEQYAPVCGRIGNSVRTFSNACFAQAARAEIISQGPCAD